MTAAVDLESRLDELRQTVAALQAAANSQPRVNLVPAESAPYLGQAVDMILTVLNRADSTPLENAPVTLITSWGVLRGEDDLIEGASIAGNTGVDGTVRVTLRANVSLDTNEDQDALEAMLALLDPAAAAPSNVLAVFQTLAQQYRWEANSGYRAAVDAYFHDFGQKILRSATQRDYMTAWTLIPATVVAYVAETAGNTAGAATVTVGFRDWLGPWYQVFEGYATSQIQLGGDFTFVKQQASTPSGLIAGVFARTGNAVDAEFGEVGKKVAQQVAQRAIGDFLNTGISDLSSDMRQAVGPILDTGARALASAGGSVVSALGQTHAVAVTTAGSVATKVDRTDFDSALTLKANAADVVAVQKGLAAKADLSALTDFQAKTTSALGAKADLSAFTTFQTQINANLQVKANASDLQAVQSTLANKADQSALTAGLQTKANATDLLAAQAAIAKKADQTALDALQRTTTASLSAKADLTAFTTFQAQTNNAIATKADAADLKALQTTVAVKADASVLQTFESQVNSSLISKANVTDLQTVQTSLAGKAEASALSTFQNQTTAALRAKVDATAVNALTNRITALENRIK